MGEGRERKSKRRDTDPNAKEMAMAARQLKWHLDWIVSVLDEGVEAGKTEAETWATVSLRESAVNEGGVPKRDPKRTPHPAIEALQVFAKDGVVDRRRFFRALCLSSVAKRFLAGTLSPEEAWRDATIAREDTLLDEEETRNGLGAIRSMRSPEQQWREAYRVLAWDADVYPLPDTRRGLRGALKRLYLTDWPAIPERD